MLFLGFLSILFVSVLEERGQKLKFERMNVLKIVILFNLHRFFTNSPQNIELLAYFSTDVLDMKIKNYLKTIIYTQQFHTSPVSLSTFPLEYR